MTHTLRRCETNSCNYQPLKMLQSMLARVCCPDLQASALCVFRSQHTKISGVLSPLLTSEHPQYSRSGVLGHRSNRVRAGYSTAPQHGDDCNIRMMDVGSALFVFNCVSSIAWRLDIIYCRAVDRVLSNEKIKHEEEQSNRPAGAQNPPWALTKFTKLALWEQC